MCHRSVAGRTAVVVAGVVNVVMSLAIAVIVTVVVVVSAGWWR